MMGPGNICWIADWSRYDNEKGQKIMSEHKQKILDNEAELLKALRDASASGVSDKSLPDIMHEVKQRLRSQGRLGTPPE